MTPDPVAQLAQGREDFVGVDVGLHRVPALHDLPSPSIR